MELRVASLNIDSIVNLNRRAELISSLQINRIDICLIQETKSDNKIKLRIPGYNVLRNDTIRGRAGTAIILRDYFNFRNHLRFCGRFYF